MQNTQITRRHLFTLGAGASVVALGGCGIFTQTASGAYGLSQAVISFIQTAVQTVASYLPAAESIAATAASLFGPTYSAIVTIGSTAINQVVSYLQNLIANPPTVGGALRATGSALRAQAAAVYRGLGVPMPSGSLAGYTKNGVPVFAQ